MTRIERIRRIAGLTQLQLACRLGCGLRTVVRFERREAPTPRLYLLAALTVARQCRAARR